MAKMYTPVPEKDDEKYEKESLTVSKKSLFFEMQAKRIFEWNVWIKALRSIIIVSL